MHHTRIRVVTYSRTLIQRSSLGEGKSGLYRKVVLCVCNQCAFADNRADAVDQLLIIFNLTLMVPFY